MKRVIITLLTVIIIAGTSLFQAIPAVAEGDLSDVKDQINELEEKQEEVNSKQNNISDKTEETESKIEANEQKQATVTEQIEQIDRELKQTKNKILQKEQEIETTNQEIEQLKKDINNLKKRIKEREQLLKSRLRALQQSGGSISYIEVLMGAQDFGDFLNRATAVTKIMEQDKNIMETHIAEKNELQTKQTDLEKKKKSLIASKEELESLKDNLKNQMAKKEELMAQLGEQHKQLEQHKMSLQEEQELLRSQEAAIKKAMELAEQKKERLEQLAAQKKDNGEPSTAPTSTGGNGMIGWPVFGGYITDYYGTRGGNHHGIDVGHGTARVGGNVPIYAAATGVVSRSYLSSSYGNVVFISHVIDGQLYTTVYAHMKYTPLVNDGAIVQKGQQIGTMGSTGDSTGPHLHFELHRGSWNLGKTNSINPLTYLP